MSNKTLITKDDLEKIGKVQNDYMKRRFSTRYSQYNYDITKLRFLNSFAYGLFVFYFFLSAIYLGIILIGPNKDKFSNFYKGNVFLILVLFPYLITPLEYILLRVTLFLTETIVGNVFDTDDYNYIIDQTYLPRFLQS